MFPRRASLLLGLLALLLNGGRTAGEELRLTPSLVLKEEYNDNLFLSESDRREVFITAASPALEYLRRSERGEGSLSARLNALFYSDRSDRDSVEQFYRGRGAYRLTPRLRATAEGDYSRESRPDRGLEESGLAVIDKSRRLRLAASTEYALDERTTASLDYGYETIEYSNRSDLDSAAHQFGIGLTRNLTETLAGRGRLSFSRYLFEDTTVGSYSATVGVVRQVEEKWSVAVDAGGRFTRSEFDPPPFLAGLVEEESEDVGWVASASLNYQGERGGGSLLFSRNVTVASGRGGATERTGLVLDLRRRFTWELTGALKTGFYLNEAEGGEFAARDIDEKTILINPVLRYEFSRDLFAEASYQYSRVIDDAGNRDADQNRVFVQLTARHPLLD